MSGSKILCRIAISSFAVALPAMAGGVAVKTTILTDNGDGDGFADSHETVTLRLSVENTSGVALTGVTVQLDALTPNLVCLLTPSIGVGDLSAGESKTPVDGFVFTVLDVDRTALGLDPFDPLTASFAVTIGSTPAQSAYPAKLHVDLDLDITGGSGPTTYFESFEGTLGTFQVQNLDSGLASLAAADGYRCQYADPDNPNSNSYGFPELASICYPGINAAHGSQVYWGLSGPAFSPAGGRGFSGFHSLFFGVDLGPPKNWTTPVAILETVRMADPVYIARDAVSPTLAFKHQTSFASEPQFGGNYDSAVVMVQVADGAGPSTRNWIKIDGWKNPYDAQASNDIFSCAFDPVDDGTTEDDFFMPEDPNRRYGPSSTCWPEYTFTQIGETSNPFAAQNLGRADGPGLRGLWGIGTWVESKFDLSQFRGRGIRVRFLVAALKDDNVTTTWEEYAFANPFPGDDGWWIDDVEITEALTTPPVAAVDTTDNTGLINPAVDADVDAVPNVCDNCAATANSQQQNADLDGFGDACDPCPFDATNTDPDADTVCGAADNCPFTENLDQFNQDGDPAGLACDCNDAVAAVYPGAAEVNDGLDNNCPGDLGYSTVDEISGTFGFNTPGSKEILTWPAQASAFSYHVVRATDAGFTAGCVQFTVFQPTRTDSTVPTPSQVLYYLVRPSTPNRGSYGRDSLDNERTPSCSP